MKRHLDSRPSADEHWHAAGAFLQIQERNWRALLRASAADAEQSLFRLFRHTPPQLVESFGIAAENYREFWPPRSRVDLDCLMSYLPGLGVFDSQLALAMFCAAERLAVLVEGYVYLSTLERRES